MSLLTKQKIAQIQQNTLSWYATNRRDLPWRETTDPYKILVSEVMLQQTQVSRAIPKYGEFLTRFPTVATLAVALPGDVVRAWKGLGYNRRALNLLRAAQMIVNDHGGRVPSDLDALRKLPGIGRYTAGAIRNFAFGLNTPAVDTNVKQFIDHFVPKILPNPPLQKEGVPGVPLFCKEGLGEISSGRSEANYYDIAQQLMPKNKAREWLHAVMDYSALVLKPLKIKDSALGSTRRVESRKSEPFVGSNRYLRGRIIDRLRDKPQRLDVLFMAIAQPIDVEKERFTALVANLQDEGFLIRTAGAVLKLV